MRRISAHVMPCALARASALLPFRLVLLLLLEAVLQFVENKGVGGVELDVASFEPPGMSGWRCFDCASKRGFDLMECRAALYAENFIGIAHLASLLSILVDFSPHKPVSGL